MVSVVWCTLLSRNLGFFAQNQCQSQSWLKENKREISSRGIARAWLDSPCFCALGSAMQSSQRYVGKPILATQTYLHFQRTTDDGQSFAVLRHLNDESQFSLLTCDNSRPPEDVTSFKELPGATDSCCRNTHIIPVGARARTEIYSQSSLLESFQKSISNRHISALSLLGRDRNETSLACDSLRCGTRKQNCSISERRGVMWLLSKPATDRLLCAAWRMQLKQFSTVKTLILTTRCNISVINKQWGMRIHLSTSLGRMRPTTLLNYNLLRLLRVILFCNVNLYLLSVFVIKRFKSIKNKWSAKRRLFQRGEFCNITCGWRKINTWRAAFHSPKPPNRSVYFFKLNWQYFVNTSAFRVWDFSHRNKYKSLLHVTST